MNKIRFILGEDKHVKLLVRSPNDEPFTISVQIQETVDYPYNYPYDYPISYTGTAKPVNS